MWRSIRSISVLAFLVCGAASAQGAHDGHAAPPPARYTRTVAPYAPPDVTLVDAEGESVTLGAALDHDGPVLLQFIFTTCPAVCPALSGTFAAAQERLEDARMVSISIDPEHDTPPRLAEYARRFDAGPRWRFLTGELDDVDAVRKAFAAYVPNKMRHQPLTFLRGSPSAPWVRLDGFLSAAELVAEVRRLESR